MPRNEPNQKFKANERLKLRKRIEFLFQNGSALNEYPIQVVYVINDDVKRPGVQVAFSVSKKIFKTAASRIRIKRLMREAYRKQSSELKEAAYDNNVEFYLMLIYKSGKEVPYNEVAEKIFILLQRLKKIIA